MNQEVVRGTASLRGQAGACKLRRALLKALTVTLAVVAPAAILDARAQELRRTAEWVAGGIRDVRVVKINHRELVRQPYYVVGVRASHDNVMHLIGIKAGDLAGPIYIERRDTASTGGPIGDFDLAEMRGLLFTAYEDRESDLRVTTWDATHWNLNRIERLQDWQGGRVHRVRVAFVRQIDGFYRFVTAVSDSDRNQRIIVWDVEPQSGRIHRRGQAVGGRVDEISVALLHDNIVDLNAPTLLATVVADADQQLWTRVWKVDRAGNVTAGAGVGGGTAWRVGAIRVDSSTLLVPVREGEGRLKLVTFKVSEGGNAVDRRGELLLPSRIGWMEACMTNSMGYYTAVDGAGQRLTLQRWRVLGDGRDIQLAATNNEGGFAEVIACAGDSTLLVVAVKDSDGRLRVLLHE
jgi:hypothetical protein